MRYDEPRLVPRVEFKNLYCKNLQWSRWGHQKFWAKILDRIGSNLHPGLTNQLVRESSGQVQR
jgi:hypothetical protein